MDIVPTSRKKGRFLAGIPAVLSGTIFVFVLLEIALCAGGFILLSVQEYRNRQAVDKKNAYRILCLGESTTAQQWPAPLEKVLNARSTGLRFSVIDKGVIGTNTNVILQQLTKHLDAYKPDMVVIMAGINDRDIAYYYDIPGADNVVFRHCRVYRLIKLVHRHIANKLGQEDMRRIVAPRYAAGAEAKTARAFGPAVNDNQLDDTAWVERGFTQHGQSVFRQAEASFKKALALNPKNNNAYEGLGFVYKDQGRFAMSERAFRSAIGLNPAADMAYLGLGLLYRDQGRCSEAESAFKKAIELNPGNDRAYTELGYMYRDQGDLIQAERVFKRVIDLNPCNDMVHVELGVFYQIQGNELLAEDWLKKSLVLNPRNEKAYLELGFLYRGQNKLIEAAAMLTKVIELNPQNARVHLEFGLLFMDQNSFAQAEKSLKRAIDLNPHDDKPYRALSVLYKKIGRSSLAQRYADKVNIMGLEYNTPVTGRNFRKMYEILTARGIRLVCAQYPMRSVKPLQSFFSGLDHNVIFVDNEKTFRQAVAMSGTREYFLDLFGGDFGHCTEKGNKLIADNIATAILPEILHE